MYCLQWTNRTATSLMALLLMTLLIPAGSAVAGHFSKTLWQQYDPIVRSVSERYRIDPWLIHAVIWQESNYNLHAISSAGARGLMQLMPSTAADLGVHRVYAAHSNIDGGTRYLIKQLQRFGSVKKALQAYNCGPERVARGRIPPVSRRYANQVIARYRYLKQRLPASMMIARNN